MKKSFVFFSFVFAVLIMIGFGSAAICDLEAKLISQDPYPAIPGEYSELVFQIEGISNPECGTITFELLEEFPIKIEPGSKKIYKIESGAYSRNFGSFLTAPYRVVINEDAVDGENLIETRLTYRNVQGGGIIDQFNVNVEDPRVDFEVSIKDYDKMTRILTFEILNIGEKDVEALTVDIPKQSTIDVKGSSRNIIGSLDSNDDTTFTFEAIPKNGEINLVVYYNDQNNIRRMLEKSVEFDSNYFEGRARDENGNSGLIIFGVIVVLVMGFFWWRKRKKKAMHKHQVK